MPRSIFRPREVRSRMAVLVVIALVVSTIATTGLVLATTPALTVTPDDTSITVGGDTNATATLSGADEPAGGTVTIALYSDASCTSLVGSVTEDFAVSANGVFGPLSTAYTTTSTGSLYWKATYTGDTGGGGTNDPAASSCDQVTVNAATPTVSLSFTTPITVGDSTNATADLNGGYSASGTLTIGLFSDSGCTTLVGTVSEGFTVAGDGTYGPLTTAYDTTAPGSLWWGADYPGDGNNDPDNDCDELVVAQADPDVDTAIHLDGNDPEDTDFDGGNVPLGSTVHDAATVTGVGVTGLEPSGDVDFTLYGSNTAGNSNDADCTTTNDPSASLGDATLDGNDPGSAHPSDSTGALHAGDYAIDATYEGDTNYNSATSPCETVTVDPADTTTVTEVRDAADNPTTTIDLFEQVHDAATVDTDGYDQFDLGPDAQDATVVVTFTIYDNWTCDGNVVGTAEDVGISGMPAQTVESTDTTLDPGFYSFRAVYEGNSDYNTSTSACEPFTVIPTITRGSCSFDLYPDDAGQQFRLIFTPIPMTLQYRLSASNPGEFYYNGLVTGDPGEDFTVEVTLPYPWVTKGGEPTHMWGGVNIHEADGKWCVGPSGDGLGSDTDEVLLGGYDTGMGDTQTLEVNGIIGPDGFTYFRVHLDFGLKHTSPWDKGVPSANAAKNTALDPDVVLLDNQAYTFSDDAGGGATLYSKNVFKRDPGIAGLVTYQVTGDPVAATNVRIFNSKGSLVASVWTDADGWYMWTFKFSGKSYTFTVTVPAFSKSTTLTMTGKQFVIVNFMV